MAGVCVADFKGDIHHAHLRLAQQSQQRIQAFIVEGRSVSQPGMSRFRPEDLLQCALEHRQLDEDQHLLERLRTHRPPADIVRSPSRGEEERALLNPVGDPGLAVLPLPEINFTRRSPGEAIKLKTV
jgi:hypothetical protein